MLKFVLIGVVIILILLFVGYCFYLLIREKNCGYRNAVDKFKQVKPFKDSETKINILKKKIQKNYISFFVFIFATFFIVFSYFFIAHSVFEKHHKHIYRESITQEVTCINEGVLTYKCKYCNDSYTEPIPCIEHDFVESSRTEPTCIATGLIVYNCSMCNEQKNEEIPTIDHNFEVTSTVDPTCTNVGATIYNCTMCNEQKSEEIPLIDHSYEMVTTVEPTCVGEGTNVFTCTMCGTSYSEQIPVTGIHTYKTVSYTKHRNNNVCEVCGDQYYSYRTHTFSWVFYLTIIIAVACFIVVICICKNEGSWYWIRKKAWFWISLVFGVVSIGLFGFHFYVDSNQTAGKHFYDSWFVEPPDSNCAFAETSREEATYIHTGTVTYTCGECGKTYSETLPQKDIGDWHTFETYAEKQTSEISERELNGAFHKSNNIPAFSKITGKLGSSSDLDMYNFSVMSKGNVEINFSHDANNIYAYWNLTVYAPDQNTVLADGYIPHMDAGEIKTISISDAEPGTYYIKVMPASGGNPLMFDYSNANYHISITTECERHLAEKPYITKQPTCTEDGEYAIVCEHCNEILKTVIIDKTDHAFGEWVVTKEPTDGGSGVKERTCTVCGEKETVNFKN